TIILRIAARPIVTGMSLVTVTTTTVCVSVSACTSDCLNRQTQNRRLHGGIERGAGSPDPVPVSAGSDLLAKLNAEPSGSGRLCRTPRSVRFEQGEPSKVWVQQTRLAPASYAEASPAIQPPATAPILTPTHPRFPSKQPSPPPFRQQPWRRRLRLRRPKRRWKKGRRFWWGQEPGWGQRLWRLLLLSGLSLPNLA